MKLQATVIQSIPTRDGGWSLHVRLTGSTVTHLIRSPIDYVEGKRVQITGSGNDWRLV